MPAHTTYEHSRPSIAIIGMGFAGTWLEIYLLERAQKALTIFEIESYEGRRGGGVAYGECADMHQVNLSPSRQYGPHDNDQDYLAWLNTSDRSSWPEPFKSTVADKVFGPGSGAFPRSLFRLYSLDRLNEAKARAERRGIDIHYVSIMAEVMDIDESQPRAVLTLSAMINTCGNPLHPMNVDNGPGNRVIADIWVAATGHGPPLVPPFMRNIVASERALLDPWCPKIAARMAARDQSERIFYVGTGMTTYDLIMLDEGRGHTGGAVMASRHADLHHVYSEGHVHAPTEVRIPDALVYSSTADELLHGKPGYFRGAIEIFQELTAPVAEGGGGLTSEQVILAWQKYIPDLCANLPSAELRHLFREKTPLNTRAIGIAPNVGKALDRAAARGLETWAVDIHDMEERPDGIYIDLTRHDMPDSPRALHRFDRVYCGVGMSNDFNDIKERVPLWQSIIVKNEFTVPHRFGGVVTRAGGKLPGSRAGFTVGMPMTGMRIERGFAPTISGAVVSIRTDFPAAADRIMEHLRNLS